MLKLYGSGGGGDCVEKIEIVFLILVVMEGCIVKEPVLRGGNEANSVELSDF
jgi:hypothetical protein